MKSRKPIAPALQAKLRELRGGMSLSGFALKIGLSVAATSAAMAGEQVNQGTRAFLAAKVQELTGETYENNN